MCGPFSESPVPEPLKISPVGAVLKPTGAARVLQDLSWPHIKEPDLEGSTPTSFNSGVDKKMFPTMNSTAQDVLERLYQVGRRAFLAKIDWQDAYKHVPVRLSELHLQFIKLGGKLLVDAALTFGASSSPGIFDRVAELILRMALHMAGLARSSALRQLDDNVFIGREQEVRRAYETYNQLALDIGVRVAPEEQDKAFGPQTSGAILGFTFNTETWTWSMEEKKAVKIIRLLYKISEDRDISQGELQSLTGKIGFYWPLFDGLYERTFFLEAVEAKAPKNSKVQVTDNMVSQAKWWIRNITAAMENNLALPDPRGWFPAASVSIFPDASGGLNQPGSGLGAVVWEKQQIYVAHFWPPCIRLNQLISIGDGFEPTRLAYHTMFLESVAALCGLLAAPELVRGRAVVLHVDNSGVVSGFVKGHSTESLAWTVLKAIRDIGKALDCPIEIRKVRRCSNNGALVADLLSKARLDEARDLMDNPASEPGFLSRTLLAWLEAPQVSRVLGFAILAELKMMGVPVHTSYVEETEELEQLVRVGRMWQM